MKKAVSLLTALHKQRLAHKTGIHFIINKDETRFVSYHDLYQDAHCYLKYLKEHGLKSGSELILLAEDNSLFLKIFWACLFGGIIPVPLSPIKTKEHQLKLKKVLQKLNNPAIFTSNEQWPVIQSLIEDDNILNKNSKIITETGTLTGEKLDYELPENIKEETIAYIQFSSGSTGDPKGVTLTHQNLVYNTSDIKSATGITHKDCMLSWMPLTHDMGLIGVHLTGVISGINQYLMPPALFLRYPALWMQKAAEVKASLLYSPNFGYSYFLNGIKDTSFTCDLSNVRVIYNGAEPISYELCERFQKRLASCNLHPNAILPVYGLAEASVAVTIPKPQTPIKQYVIDRKYLNTGNNVRFLSDANASKGIRFVEVGKPIPNCEIKICNDQMKPLPKEQVGNICIKGKNVTSGYYNDDTATKRVKSENDWIITGDLGFLTQDGTLVVTGRSKNILIFNGQNYYPQDIERAASKALEMASGMCAACQVYNDKLATNQLVVFIVTKEKPEKFAAKVQLVKDAVLYNVGIPAAQIIPIKRLPKTTSGKVRYFKLIEDFQEGKFEALASKLDALTTNNSSIFEPKDELEYTIQDIFQSIFTNTTPLRKGKEYRNALSSLKMTQISLEIERRLHIKIELKDFFRAHTLEDFITLLKSKEKNNHQKLQSKNNKYFELLPSQNRIWFIEELDADVHPYNINFNFKIEGTINAAMLQKSIKYLTQRHQMLRTAFSIDQNKITHVVSTNVQPDFTYSKVENNRSLSDLIPEVEKFVQSGFDLTKAPLLKTRLYEMQNGKYLLSFCLHHIISDGWSVQIFLSELKTTYEAFIRNATPVLAKIDYNYQDYVSLYNSKNTQEKEKTLKSYWEKQLTDFPSLPSLPAIKTPKTNKNFEGDTITYLFNPASGRKINQLINTNGKTVFTHLITLLLILLYKYTGQSDLVLGTSTNGRNQAGFHNVIGYFINTLLLRMRFDAAMSYKSLLLEVETQLIDAYNHQEFSFEQLLNEARKLNGTNSPLFNVFITIQEPEEAFNLSSTETKTEMLPINDKASLTDLYFDFLYTKGKLELIIKYSLALFEKWQIQELAKHLDLILNWVYLNPESAINKFSLFSNTDIESEIALQKLNKPVSKDSAGTYLEKFKAAVAKSPHQVCVIENSKHITYSEIDRKSDQLATLLRIKCKVQPENRIMVILPRSVDLIIAILAISKCGAAFILVDTDYPVERIKTIIADSNPALIISDLLFNDFAVTSMQSLLQGADTVFKPLQPVPVTPQMLAYIIYTSGTTGRPKGIMIEHKSLANYAENFKTYFSVNQSDRVLVQSSVTFDILIEEIFPALLKGATLIVNPESGRDTYSLIKILEAQKVSIVTTVPKIIESLNGKLPETTNLRTLISGGDRITPAFIDSIPSHIHIYNTYGPSEVTVCATYYKITNRNETGKIGFPVTNAQVYILDADKNICPMGVCGEIAVAGLGLARAYLNEPEVTQEKFIWHSIDGGKRMYLTGDIGRWNYDGSITFLGRKDNQIKTSGGIRFEPVEIENLLIKHPDIKEVASVVKSTEKGTKFLTVFYTGKYALNEAKLKDYLLEYLPLNMLPAQILYIEKMPFQASGKINYKRLQELYAPTKQNTYQANNLEKMLCTVWKEVLQLEQIGVFDNFFDVGGDSIKALQIINKVAPEGYNIKLKDVFQYQNIHQMATFLEVTNKSQDHEIDEVTLSAILEVEKAPHLYHQNIEIALSAKIDIAVLVKALWVLVEKQELLRAILLKDKKLWSTTKLEVSDIRNSKYWVDTTTNPDTRDQLSAISGRLIQLSINTDQRGVNKLVLALHWVLCNTGVLNLLLEQLSVVYYQLKESTNLQSNNNFQVSHFFNSKIALLANTNHALNANLFSKTNALEYHCQVQNAAWGRQLMKIEKSASLDQRIILLLAMHNAVNEVINANAAFWYASPTNNIDNTNVKENNTYLFSHESSNIKIASIKDQLALLKAQISTLGPNQEKELSIYNYPQDKTALITLDYLTLGTDNFYSLMEIDSLEWEFNPQSLNIPDSRVNIAFVFFKVQDTGVLKLWSGNGIKPSLIQELGQVFYIELDRIISKVLDEGFNFKSIEDFDTSNIDEEDLLSILE